MSDFLITILKVVFMNTHIKGSPMTIRELLSYFSNVMHTSPRTTAIGLDELMNKGFIEQTSVEISSGLILKEEGLKVILENSVICQMMHEGKMPVVSMGTGMLIIVDDSPEESATGVVDKMFREPNVNN